MTRPIETTLLLLCAAGCAVAYQPNTWWRQGGWSDSQVAQDRWLVRYEGNANTDIERVLDFSMLRAADLCERTGYANLLVLQTDTEIQIYESEESETVVDEDGNEEEVSDTTIEHIPSATRSIQCLQTDDGSHTELLSVSFVRRSIRNKYNL